MKAVQVLVHCLRARIRLRINGINSLLSVAGKSGQANRRDCKTLPQLLPGSCCRIIFIVSLRNETKGMHRDGIILQSIKNDVVRFAIPVLLISDPVLAESFYCNQLGLTKTFSYCPFGDTGPYYLGIIRDSIRVHLSSLPDDGLLTMR
jgi:hypothetical protein